jgi:ParB-like chromosome segregation protein Spo0J
MAKKQTMDIQLIAIKDIRASDRRREEFGDIEALAKSIAEYGLINPITVDSEYNLLAGERRMRACKALKWKEIPCRLYGDLTDKERQEIEIEENVRRKDLTAAERSKTLVDLAEFAAEVLRETVREDSLPESGNESSLGKRKSGGQQKPDSEKKVSDRIGVPQQTINDAKHHVSAFNKYPELAGPGIPQKEAITIARNLDALPEEERIEARSKLASGDLNTLAILADKPPMPSVKAKSKDETATDKWRGIFSDIRRAFYGIRQNSGIAFMTSRWSLAECQDSLNTLTEFHAELENIITDMKERIHEFK